MFSNILVDAGAVRMSDILSRQVFPKYWSIRLGAAPGNRAPCESRSIGTDCSITEAPLFGSGVSNSLIAKSNNGVLTLVGSIAAGQNGTIDVVSTHHDANTCLGSLAFPDNCPDSNSSTVEITSTTLRTGIPVIQGQEISVTVRLSFE